MKVQLLILILEPFIVCTVTIWQQFHCLGISQKQSVNCFSLLSIHSICNADDQYSVNVRIKHLNWQKIPTTAIHTHFHHVNIFQSTFCANYTVSFVILNIRKPIYLNCFKPDKREKTVCSCCNRQQ